MSGRLYIGNQVVCRTTKESLCSANSTMQCNPALDMCTFGCPGMHRCTNGYCIPKSNLCDGKLDEECDDDTEWLTGIGFSCVRNRNRCIIPQRLLYDDISDCDKGEDICFDLTR